MLFLYLNNAFMKKHMHDSTLSSNQHEKHFTTIENFHFSNAAARKRVIERERSKNYYLCAILELKRKTFHCER
mgnify:CR=1 FL=1